MIYRIKSKWWGVLMHSISYQLLVVSIVVIVVLLTNQTILNAQKEKTEVLEDALIIAEINNPTAIENTAREISGAEKPQPPEKVKLLPSVPEYTIGLSEYLQQYTFDLTQQCENVSYELALSVLYTESKFNASATNVNRNGTIDRGIAQINSGYTEHYADVSGFNKDFNPFIAEHGIKACVFKLQELAEVWKLQGVTDKGTIELYAIQSYNRGVIGFKEYMAYNGPQSNYSKLIFNRKNELLNEGEILTK